MGMSSMLLRVSCRRAGRADVALAAARGVAQVEDHVVQVEVGDLERADLAGPGGERDGHVDGDAGLVGHGVADGLELFGLVGRGPDARVALDDGVAAVGRVGGLAHDPVEEDVALRSAVALPNPRSRNRLTSRTVMSFMRMRRSAGRGVGRRGPLRGG